MKASGLLPMAKLAEQFLGARNIGKVPNWKVAKSRIVLLLILVLVLVLVLVHDKRFELA